MDDARKLQAGADSPAEDLPCGPSGRFSTRPDRVDGVEAVGRHPDGSGRTAAEVSKVLHSSPSSVQFPSAAQDRLSIVKPTTITTMPFHQELKRKREAAKLSQETAASWLRLAARDYGDRESGRVDMQFPEKFGLLVGIGVPPNEAADIADRTDELCMDEWGEQSNASAADLFVRESATQIILSNRTDERLDYPIAKSSIKNPWHIVDLVVDLGGKTWVTKTHLKAFAVTALRYLRDGSQTTRSRPRL